MKLMVKIFYEQYSIASGGELNFNTVRTIPNSQAEGHRPPSPYMW